MKYETEYETCQLVCSIFFAKIMSLFVRWMNLYIQNMLLTIVDHCVTLSLPAAVQAHLPTKPDAKPAALPLVTNPRAAHSHTPQT